MPDTSSNAPDPDSFITRWSQSGGSERSNYALFLSELCDLLGVPRPDASVDSNEANHYVIDRAFPRTDKDGSRTTVYLDLYKRGHFVLETKQGSSGEGDKIGHGKRGTAGWDKALDRAYNQALDYIRAIPAAEGRPPFLIVCDVGHCFDIYAEFTGTGGTYLAFPNPKKRRIFLEELRAPEARALLKTIWTDPHSLDPSKHAAKVTREVADTLASLAASLEKAGHDPQVIAAFLQRILFTLFAEDVGLLPDKAFEKLLEQAAKTPQGFATLTTTLWKDMANGADFSTAIMDKVLHFNGGLFENATALPLDADQIQLLVDAARQDWREVEPAIFGTLLERALDPRERHKLGAHYTPRSYVERLIEPTLMQPLREQWNAVKTAAALHHDQNKDDKARAEIEKFHRQLCELRVLDPACGSGNFLYIAMARMKELEAEVLDLLEELGGDRTFELNEFKVRPAQFLGIELNARAAAIAQLVLWIGYFQWHLRTNDQADTGDRPLLKSENSIQNRDAVLDYDERIPRRDENGAILTIWNGITTNPHPVTGKEVPDESATLPLFDYTNPRRSEWPQADYIVGNPPFLGNKRMRDGLGDGYVEALRLAWKKCKPDSWDFVMFWWHQAAELVRDGKAKAFGFITTNSIHQTFNRRCLEPFLGNDKKPVSITFAIPDHPWVDSADGAAVRIAMTAAEAGNSEGRLVKVTEEREINDGEHEVALREEPGKIAANLKVGADVSSTWRLDAASGLSNQGVTPLGTGFRIAADDFPDEEIARARANKVVRYYAIGRDLVRQPEPKLIIDFYPASELGAQTNYPHLFQHVVNTVKPDRDHQKRDSYRLKWWQFAEPRSVLRNSLEGLERYIATCRTAKHRLFTFLSEDTIPDAKIVAISLDTSEHLAILSSVVHCLWAEHVGVRMGMGNDLNYNHADCFNKFPFPDLSTQPELRERLRSLGEKLDAHRKARQAEHPVLTLTGIYNVLEKLRRNEPLSDKEKTTHDQGLVTLLKQIHDDIDTAVCEAYQVGSFLRNDRADQDGRFGETPLPCLADRLAQGDDELEQSILQFLVDLNHRRAAEEAQGKIRYLRPEFQDPEGTQKEQELDLPATEDNAAAAKAIAAKARKRTWPRTLPEQVAALQELLPELGPDAAALTAAFGRASKKRQSEIEQILQTLAALGQI